MPLRVSKCPRCGGQLIWAHEEGTCLMCGHVSYGEDFRPLHLTRADQRRFTEDIRRTSESLPVANEAE